MIMSEQKLTKQQQKRIIHGRIWFSGFIATAVFVGFMAFLSRDDYNFYESLVQFVIFYTVWVISHYLFLKREFKRIDAS